MAHFKRIKYIYLAGLKHAKFHTRSKIRIVSEDIQEKCPFVIDITRIVLIDLINGRVINGRVFHG